MRTILHPLLAGLEGSMPKSQLSSADMASAAARGVSPGVAQAAANAETHTLQEARITRLLRSISDAKARGQVTTTVRLVDLEALICTMALVDQDVRDGARVAFATHLATIAADDAA